MFETEHATQLRDQGYRTGWKDGYNAGYDAAWKEVKEQKAAEKDEDLTEVSIDEDLRIRAVLDAAEKRSQAVDLKVKKEAKEVDEATNPFKPGDWVKIRRDIKDDHCEIWHYAGATLQVVSLAKDGEGLMFYSDLGIHWTHVEAAEEENLSILDKEGVEVNKAEEDAKKIASWKRNR